MSAFVGGHRLPEKVRFSELEVACSMSHWKRHVKCPIPTPCLLTAPDLAFCTVFAVTGIATTPGTRITPQILLSASFYSYSIARRLDETAAVNGELCGGKSGASPRQARPESVALFA